MLWGDMVIIMKNIKAKGEVGYIDCKKKLELLTAVLILACAAAVFVLGLALNKWEKGNIFTIIACLLVIPMARFATTYVMLFPFKSVKPEKAKDVEERAKGGSIIYADVILTSEKRAMGLDFLVVTGDKVLGVIGREKEDNLDIRNYLQDILKRRGYDYKVTIAEDYARFNNLLASSDCVADMKFEDDEDREAFEKDRLEVCKIIESLMP